VISATDERALTLSGKLAEVQSQRDRIAADPHCVGDAR